MSAVLPPKQRKEGGAGEPPAEADDELDLIHRNPKVREPREPEEEADEIEIRIKDQIRFIEELEDFSEIRAIERRIAQVIPEDLTRFAAVPTTCPQPVAVPRSTEFSYPGIDFSKPATRSLGVGIPDEVITAFKAVPAVIPVRARLPVKAKPKKTATRKADYKPQERETDPGVPDVRGVPFHRYSKPDVKAREMVYENTTVVWDRADARELVVSAAVLVGVTAAAILLARSPAGATALTGAVPYLSDLEERVVEQLEASFFPLPIVTGLEEEHPVEGIARIVAGGEVDDTFQEHEDVSNPF